MPKGPRGEKRPADVVGNAVLIGRIAVGDVPDAKDNRAHATETASEGGRARARKLTSAERSRIAKSGATARWGKVPAEPGTEE